MMTMITISTVGTSLAMPVEPLRRGVAVLEEIPPPLRHRAVEAGHQHHAQQLHVPPAGCQSTAPGVSTSRIPNAQVAIIAGCHDLLEQPALHHLEPLALAPIRLRTSQ